MTNAELKLRRRRALYQIRSRAFLDRGLTVLGAIRKIQPVRDIPRSIKGKARQAARQKIYHSRMIAAGIATGGPRRGSKRIRRAFNLGISAVHNVNEYQRVKYRILSAENRARGLTALGKPRKNTLQPSALEVKWREFRDAIHIPEARDWSDFGLSHSARDKYLSEAA